MEEDLEYWEDILAQRTEDLRLEEERFEDDELIKLLKGYVEEAQQKVEELTNE
jgi:hypothetical protein